MKSHVIVYYANETDPGRDRLERILRRAAELRGEGPAWKADAAERVESDATDFPRTTREQVALLEHLTRAHGPAAGLAGVVFFTNERARAGLCRAAVSGGPPSSEVAFQPPPAGDPLLEESPLAAPAALVAALRASAAMFPPEKHDYVLVTRSHGTAELALTVGLLEETLERPEPETEPGRPSPEDGDLGVRGLGFSGLGRRGMGGKGLMLGGAEEAGRGVGIDKGRYLEILREAAPMRFDLVFMDSCGSELSCEQFRDLSDNVLELYGSDEEGLDYADPDYGRIHAEFLESCRHGGFAGAMRRLLAATPNVVRVAACPRTPSDSVGATA